MIMWWSYSTCITDLALYLNRTELNLEFDSFVWSFIIAWRVHWCVSFQVMGQYVMSEMVHCYLQVEGIVFLCKSAPLQCWLFWGGSCGPIHGNYCFHINLWLRFHKKLHWLIQANSLCNRYSKTIPYIRSEISWIKVNRPSAKAKFLWISAEINQICHKNIVKDTPKLLHSFQVLIKLQEVNHIKAANTASSAESFMTFI